MKRKRQRQPGRVEQSIVIMDDKKQSASYPSEIPWTNPSEDRVARSPAMQDAYRHSAELKLSKKTNASTAVCTPPPQDLNPAPAAPLAAATESRASVRDAYRQELPGAYSVQSGETMELQNPGFISPQDQEEMQSRIESPGEAQSTSEMPLAAEVAGEDDLRDQVRRIMTEEAVHAEGVLAVQQDDPELGALKENTAKQEKNHVCSRRRAGFVAVILVIAVALGVAVPLGNSAAANTQASGGTGTESTDTGDTDTEGTESTDPPSPTPSPTPFPTRSPAELCEQGSDCTLGACAFETYTAAAKAVCCPTGRSDYISSLGNAFSGDFCMDQPNGATCPINSLCESGICIFGTCEAEPRGVSEMCEENTDCATGVCAFGVCQAGPFEVNEECEEDLDCTLGACAFETYTAAAKAVCCPTGKKDYISSLGNTFSGNFCMDQPNGAACPKILSARAAFASLVPARQNREGYLKCARKTLTVQPVSAPLVCAKQDHLKPMRNAEEDLDCTLGACAFETYTVVAKAVCCPTGKKDYISSLNTFSGNFCMDQPNGAACPENSLCESGICIFGTCEAEPRGVSEMCEENADCATSVCAFGVCQAGPLEANEECEEDLDCTLGACAFETYTAAAKAVCCPTGKKNYISSLLGNTFSGNFCMDQPNGAACPENSLCASGVCTGGVCE